MNGKYDILTSTAEYTGNGIYRYYGKLADGNYFRTCDDWNFTEITNSDSSMESAEYTGFYIMHGVETLTGYDHWRFRQKLLYKIIADKPNGNYSIFDISKRIDKLIYEEA